MNQIKSQIMIFSFLTSHFIYCVLREEKIAKKAQKMDNEEHLNKTNEKKIFQFSDSSAVKKDKIH